ncbi:efflux RND transporter permease subunit [Grimontia sp. NTOU-MAR1]|uniref:efflux RND transporter permease subunit n=1 Tax=Grimontia sp. NTOU-MAR1 TaxID=3111011 RepID=UPI002DBCADC1|nr:MMPL family transporter [Grimontia sp. NTOU-MAR1]WRV97751.1 MMPL family transporter [Grimontia sp. NTOU-MAR1]
MNRDLSQWPTLRPWLFLVLSVLISLLAAFGASKLYFRGDYQIFFDEGNPQLQAFKELEATFNKTDTLSIVVAPANRDVFTEENLSLVKQLTNEAWQTPYASRVDSITNYQHTTAEEDDLLVEDLAADYIELDASRLAYIRDVALNEPRLVGSSVSKDGSVAVVTITFQLPDGDQSVEVNEISVFADQLLDSVSQTHSDVEFHLGGIIALNNAFALAAMDDGNTLVPMMLLVILVFLGFMLRSWKFVFATLVVIVLTIASTMGLLGWVGHYLNNGTVNVPTLIMTLAVADCVHLITSYVHGLREGKAKSEAISYALKLNFLALLITSVTTSIGFLMMNASNSPVLRDMGNLAAVGVMIAFFISVTLLPALLQLMPVKVKQSQSPGNKVMGWIADSVIRHHKMILPVSAVVVVLSSMLLVQNQVNDNSVEYFGPENTFRQAADFMEENISGTTAISLSIKSGQPQGITQPEFLQTVSTFTDWLRIQPEVDHVASISDTFKRLNKNMYADDEAYYQLPTDPELAAQYLLLYEMSLPYGLDLNNEVNIDKSAVKLLLTVDNLGSVELIDLEQRMDKWFAANAPQFDMTSSGPNLMFAHIGETNMESMLKTLPIALVLISGLLVFALRSWRLGAISLVPNLAPAIIGFGFWAVISGEINLGLSIVVTLTLGIVVDDTVHFLSKYRYARLQGRNVEEGIRYAFSTVGRALWITTVVLVAGFSVLATSVFRLNADMGMLSAMVIFIALVVDFILLPAVLLVADRKSYARESEDLVIQTAQ